MTTDTQLTTESENEKEIASQLNLGTPWYNEPNASLADD